MTELFGWSATVILTVCALPQAIRILRTRDTSGISKWMWWLYLVGHVLAIVYAILIWQPPLLFKYIVNIAISLYILVLLAR